MKEHCDCSALFLYESLVTSLESLAEGENLPMANFVEMEACLQARDGLTGRHGFAGLGKPLL
jgi:hypothetical protein